MGGDGNRCTLAGGKVKGWREEREREGGDNKFRYLLWFLNEE
jgi:hypothetical protein